MKNKFVNSLCIFVSTIIGFSSVIAQQSHVLTVKANHPTATIPPTLWGIFFEDINLAADGGLYAELVKNRSFEFTNPLMGWKEIKQQGSSILVINRSTTNPSNPRFARVSVQSEQPYGIVNEGFRGMGIKKDTGYVFSILARLKEGTIGTIHVQLINAKGDHIGEESIVISGYEWKKYSVHFTAKATEPKARLKLMFDGKAVYDVDMISLFPHDTWKHRAGGLRADLVQMLADLKPGFIRFPGGCIVEGRDLANRYQWKKTVGPVEERPLLMNRWNTEFAVRSTPDYFQSFGLGFYEYFLLAEDIGAAPLPILNCGMACQFNSAEVANSDDLDEYIQDALDLIEFANGPANTKWGKLRSEMGHPLPFNLTMMGVGNENWGPQYIERLKIFTKAIKDKYPKIKLVNSSGTDPNGERYDYLNGELRKMNVDFIDEHYYKSPDWFLQNAKRYDTFSRNSSKVFAGEYAAHSKLSNEAVAKNNWESALAEAAFMTGLERNADVVQMASYAPLFAHVDGWQWAPDLIWFDNLHSYATPNYYVQQLFSINKGSIVVPIQLKNEVVAGTDSLYATACVDKQSNELILKIVNTASRQQDYTILMEGVSRLSQLARVTVLSSDKLAAVNSFRSPMLIAPRDMQVNVNDKKMTLPLLPLSLTVVRVKMN